MALERIALQERQGGTRVRDLDPTRSAQIALQQEALQRGRGCIENMTEGLAGQVRRQCFIFPLTGEQSWLKMHSDGGRTHIVLHFKHVRFRRDHAVVEGEFTRLRLQ